jgi:hypothetical protein
MFLAGYINLTLHKEFEMEKQLEFDYDPEPGSDKWEYIYRTITPRVQDTTPAVRALLDNDHQMVLDNTCMDRYDTVPGDLTVLHDTDSELDGKTVLVVGVKTRFEVEGG